MVQLVEGIEVEEGTMVLPVLQSKFARVPSRDIVGVLKKSRDKRFGLNWSLK